MTDVPWPAHGEPGDIISTPWGVFYISANGELSQECWCGKSMNSPHGHQLEISRNGEPHQVLRTQRRKADT